MDKIGSGANVEEEKEGELRNIKRKKEFTTEGNGSYSLSRYAFF